MFARPLQTLILASSISLAALSAAQAVEAQAVAERFKALIANQGSTISWASIDESDGKVTLKGVTSKGPGADASSTIGDVSFEGVEEADNGDYVVETLSMPTYSSTTEGATVTMEGLAISGAVLPSPETKDPIGANGFFDSLDIDSLKVDTGGKQVFSMSGLNYTLEREDGGAIAFAGTADAFTADLSTTADQQTLGVLTMLGLAQPKGSFEMAGNWSTTDGALSLEQMDFTVDDAGTLGITLDISGYTQEVVKAMQDMQKTMANATEEQKAAAGMAAMGLMQQLTFAGASIRYDDESLAGRALDFAAGAQNMQRTDLVKMAQMMIPMSLGNYVKPEFAKVVADEVAKFVEDPKSIEITAEPAQPVPFMAVGMSAMSAPQNIPDQLGITVTANEDGEE